MSSSRKFLKHDKGELINQLLGKQGMNLSVKRRESIKHIICGYFDALEKTENKEYFIKYFEDFKIIRKFIYIKSKRLYAKYNFFYNYQLIIKLQ